MKRLALAISLLCLPTIAMAQQSEFTFKFTPQETDVVWEALRELPVKRVESIMQKMREQVVEQNKPKTAVKPEEKKND